MPLIEPVISKGCDVRSPQPPAGTSIRVVLLDLLSIVPYYTGHLCTGFTQVQGAQVSLASITYDHDPGFFQRMNTRKQSGLFDFAYRLGRMPAPIRRGLKLLEYLVNLSMLLVRFARSTPEVVHVQFLPLLSYGLPVEWWFLKSVRALGARLVYTVHNVLPQDGGERHRRTYRRVYQLVDGLICHDTQAAARLATEFAVPPQRIWEIPHGTMFERMAFEPPAGTSPGSLRTKLGLPSTGCIVLWHGILRRYKGVPFLLKAWKGVCEDESTALLVILGNGEDAEIEMVKREVQALGISRSVRLELRFVPVGELSEFLDAADILVYPYRESTTSGALMTGLVHGKATVASALPAFEQLLSHERNALLVSYGDIAALTATLLRLIRDAGLRERLGQALRHTDAALPRWPEIARRTYECYRAVISGPLVSGRTE